MPEYPYLSRRCRYCGRTFQPQASAHSASRAPFTDAAGRTSWRHPRTADAMPAYLIRQWHERDECPRRPGAPSL